MKNTQTDIYQRQINVYMSELNIYCLSQSINDWKKYRKELEIGEIYNFV